MLDQYFPYIFDHSSWICRPNLVPILFLRCKIPRRRRLWLQCVLRKQLSAEYDLRWLRWAVNAVVGLEIWRENQLILVGSGSISIYDGFKTNARWLGMGFLNHQQYGTDINRLAVDFFRQIVLRFVWLPCSSPDLRLSAFVVRAVFFETQTICHWRYRLALRKYSDALQCWARYQGSTLLVMVFSSSKKTGKKTMGKTKSPGWHLKIIDFGVIELYAMQPWNNGINAGRRIWGSTGGAAETAEPR